MGLEMEWQSNFLDELFGDTTAILGFDLARLHWRDYSTFAGFTILLGN